VAVQTIAILFGKCTTFYTIIIGTALAAAKEFWYDYVYEDACTRGSSLEDFGFYEIGIILGFLFVFFSQLPGIVNPLPCYYDSCKKRVKYEQVELKEPVFNY